MGNRVSKVYTRTGDDGSTGLGDGTRVGKDSIRVDTYGTTDELNCCLGLVLAEDDVPDDVRAPLDHIQQKLFDLGGELCVPGMELIHDDDITWLEEVLDALNADLPRLKEFIMPGGSRASAACHLARTVCRRAERRVIALTRTEDVRPQVQRYLNRLSDLLFVMARVLARGTGHDEVMWDHVKVPRPRRR